MAFNFIIDAQDHAAIAEIEHVFLFFELEDAVSVLVAGFDDQRIDSVFNAGGFLPGHTLDQIYSALLMRHYPNKLFSVTNLDIEMVR